LFNARGGRQGRFGFDGIEPGLWIIDLTRFPAANRLPSRIKCGTGFALKRIVDVPAGLAKDRRCT
jgi:hypothetical protein